MCGKRENMIGTTFFISRFTLYYRVSGSSTEITVTHSLQFDFKAIEAATNKFSESNLIGQGGFGAVFKVSFYRT